MESIQFLESLGFDISQEEKHYGFSGRPSGKTYRKISKGKNYFLIWGEDINDTGKIISQLSENIIILKNYIDKEKDNTKKAKEKYTELYNKIYNLLDIDECTCSDNY